METQLELAERAVRFMKLLPLKSDDVLVVLKGHLLIEELITEILKVSLSQSNPIEVRVSERSQYAKKLELCWALNSKYLDDNLWKSLKTINEIRNKMAHSVEPKGVVQRIEKFCSEVLPVSAFEAKDYRGKELAFSISWLHIVLSGHLHEIKNS